MLNLLIFFFEDFYERCFSRFFGFRVLSITNVFFYNEDLVEVVLLLRLESLDIFNISIIDITVLLVCKDRFKFLIMYYLKCLKMIII